MARERKRQMSGTFELKLRFRRGSLLLKQKTKFPGKITKPKYFLLMEDYLPNKKSLLALVTTSKLWRLKASTGRGVIISIRPIGKTLIFCRKYYEIPISMSAHKEYENVGFLANLKRVESAIKRSALPNNIKDRMVPKLPKIKRKTRKRKKDTKYRYFGREQIDAIKKKFFEAKSN